MPLRITRTAPALAFLALACPASAREPSGIEQQKAIVASLPFGIGEISISAEADWYPNIIGYNDLRSGFLGSGAVMGIRVWLVITPTAVVVEGWDQGAGHYSIMKLIKVSDLHQVSTDKYMFGVRLVLQSADYSYNSFNLIDGDVIDSTKAKQAGAYLSQQMTDLAAQTTSTSPKQP